LGYGSPVPPCFDVYVWVSTDDQPEVLARFITQYIDAKSPGDPRFAAFVRTLVVGEPAVGDLEALQELRRDDAATAFSLYLNAKDHHEASITFTEEGDLVFGLGLDGPYDESSTPLQAAAVLTTLMEEFEAVAGVGGVGLPPPQSRSEWRADRLVALREGTV
jgi:hypothetical protein